MGHFARYVQRAALPVDRAGSHRLGAVAQSSSLVGKVTDESGAAMPGVSISVKSPALRVPQMTAVSGVDGDYHLLELPPGTYTVTFELSGFQTSVRTDIHLTVGFAGRVDVVMKIGELQETVQVSGQSPVVDTVNTAGQTTLMLEQLRNIPMGATMQEMLPLVRRPAIVSAVEAGRRRQQSRGPLGDHHLWRRSSADSRCRRDQYHHRPRGGHGRVSQYLLARGSAVQDQREQRRHRISRSRAGGHSQVR